MKKENIKLELKNVSKSFGDKVVLKKLNLSVREGESLVIIGPSGTGKSVLIKTILGLVQPDLGHILIDGVDTTSLSEREREPLYAQMGMLFQGGALFDSLSVWENVAFGLMEGHEKMSADAAREKALDFLKSVGLSKDVMDQSPADLSGGMKKRVSLARAIATRPAILFFDEPTTGLDPVMSEVINQLIVESVKKLGATAITITHDIHSATLIADRVAMLYGGQIVWEGSKSDFLKTKDPYIAQMKTGSKEGPIQL